MTDFATADAGIRQLHARFIDAVWRKDAEAFANLFAKDGEWKIAGFHFRGRDEIGPGFAKLLGVCQRVQLILGPPLLDVGNGEATSRMSVTEIAKMNDGAGAITMGVYYDRYVEEDGAWRFKMRHWGFHYRGPLELNGLWTDYPDFALGDMPAPDAPTYVRKPT